MQARVGIIMGSASDWEVMQGAAKILDELQVPFEAAVVSAHRTPEFMARYAASALQRGLGVLVAGAGGAAHLPGMVASHTVLPVIGVPVKSSQSLDGWDSLLSILQMPAGIPVATVALNNAHNAGLLAASILALSDPALQERLLAFKQSLKTKVLDAQHQLNLESFQFGRLCPDIDALKD
ncbi:MAG: 5-(carboxyamino)imidazole ribonucleotide mutase [Flavobacteriales bacterium]|nr:5-(carboxyamino)imidazole ribonucleotide mutase [Flavobacteriales bacterium]MCX7649437.1 5-(carboxyamino)imidazole ribonucleotide mutase [Flavobacteriales bacterium]MDW8431595.1 5-(carboxyamino)imidazole ribonucleotide mutase [Flavobacteriales bacterium]